MFRYSLLAGVALALLAPAAAPAAVRISIYPPNPDPRVTIVMKVTGIHREPQPSAGVACDGAEPSATQDLNADPGAPIIWDFLPADLCSGATMTAAVYLPEGSSFSEVAR